MPRRAEAGLRRAWFATLSALLWRIALAVATFELTLWVLAKVLLNSP